MRGPYETPKDPFWGLIEKPFKGSIAGPIGWGVLLLLKYIFDLYSIR